MKLKFRFPGRLLPSQKQTQDNLKGPESIWDNGLYFAIGLVALWLLVFIFAYLKPFANHK